MKSEVRNDLMEGMFEFADKKPMPESFTLHHSQFTLPKCGVIEFCC